MGGHSRRIEMKLQNIKTKSEFYEFADIWYQRTHALRRVWQESDEPSEKKIKAFKLWYIMLKRVIILNQIAVKINQVKPPKFEKGGFCL